MNIPNLFKPNAKKNMDLRITSYNNFFKLKGLLNKSTVSFLNEELEDALYKYKKLTISIEGLDDVDRYGIKALADLHAQSVKKNIQLSIVGYGCKKLFDHFKSCEAA